MSVEEAAAAIGKSRQTLSTYERVDGGRPPDDATLGILAARYGTTVDAIRASADPTPAPTRERESPTFPAHYSTEARVLEAELVLEAARVGLDDREADAIRHYLRHAPTAPLYAGGRPRELTEAEQLIELRAIAAGLREWIKARVDLRRDTGQARQ